MSIKRGFGGAYKAIKQECEDRFFFETKLTGYSKPLFDLEECLNKALYTFSPERNKYETNDVTTNNMPIIR